MILMISIIIPAKNERKTIGKTIRIAKMCFPNHRKEIIIVAGDRGTADTANRENVRDVKVIIQKNQGKGNALKLGFENSSGDVIIFSDADITNLNKNWIENIAKPILRNKADVCLGCYTTPWFQVATETVYRPLIKLVFPEVEEKIKSQPLTGQRAFKRWVLEKIDFYPNFGFETAINIDLVLKIRPRIKEIFLGEKIDVYKSHENLVSDLIKAIIAKAKEYNRFDRIEKSNIKKVLKTFNDMIQST